MAMLGFVQFVGRLGFLDYIIPTGFYICDGVELIVGCVEE